MLLSVANAATRPPRGHLGLRTFAHILADPRTRDIPLVLETPAFDVPASGQVRSAAARDRLAKEGMGVWRTEVSVLNRLSGGQGQLDENELEAYRTEVAAAVEMASKLRDAKGKKVDGKGAGGRKGGKAKRKAEDEEEEARDEDEDQGEGSCCESDH